jgi:hypothetical protein
MGSFLLAGAGALSCLFYLFLQLFLDIRRQFTRSTWQVEQRGLQSPQLCFFITEF